MALNYVNLTLDLFDGQGNPVTAGIATFTPTAQLTDTTDHEIVTLAPLQATFRSGGSPVIRLLATDNSALAPSGWAWTVSFAGVPGNPASFSFFLPFAGGASQNLSAMVSVSVAPLAIVPLQKVGDTGTTGYTVINGTGNIPNLSWTAPNDGNMHIVWVAAKQRVTVAQTGGAIGVVHTDPGGTGVTSTIFAGSLGIGFTTGTPIPFLVAPNTTLTVQQTSAETAGTAVLWCQLWAA